MIDTSLKKDKHFTWPKWSSTKQPESLEYLSLHCFFDRIYMYSFRICCLFCTEWTRNSIDQTKLVRLSVSCYLQLLNMHGTKATGSSLRVFFSDRALQTCNMQRFPPNIVTYTLFLFQVNLLYSNWFTSKYSTLEYIFLFFFFFFYI